MGPSTKRICRGLGVILVLCFAVILYVGLTVLASSRAEPHDVIHSSTRNVSSDIEKPVCTMAVFRDHYAREGYFPSGGSWVGKNETAHYDPDICRFRPLSPKTKILKKCFARKNITSIVMMGASQGKKYALGAKDLLGKIFNNRETLKKEKTVDGAHQTSYFADGDQYILERLSAQPRHCGGCDCTKDRFYEDDGSHNLTLEYFGMDDLIDATLRLYVREARQKSIETYQEFIFRHYLAREPPDLIIISPALNHAKFKSTPDKFASDFQHFRSMIQIYLSATTRTLWLPGLAQYGSVDATESIDRLNHVMYDILGPTLLDPDDRVLGFMDMVRVSAKCSPDWWPSNAHLKPVFYQKVITHVFEFLCGDI